MNESGCLDASTVDGPAPCMCLRASACASAIGRHNTHEDEISVIHDGRMRGLKTEAGHGVVCSTRPGFHQPHPLPAQASRQAGSQAGRLASPQEQLLEIWVNIDEGQRHRTLRRKLRQLQQLQRRPEGLRWPRMVGGDCNPHNSAGDSRRSLRWRCSVTRHCGGRQRVSAQADGQFCSVVLREMEGCVRHSGEAWEGVVMDSGLIRLHSLPASRASESHVPYSPTFAPITLQSHEWKPATILGLSYTSAVVAVAR